MLKINQLRPLQALAASLFFEHKRLLLSLPRQYGGKTELGIRLLHDITSRPFSSSSLFLAKDKKSGKRATREKFKRLFDPKKFTVNTEIVYLKDFQTSAIFMESVDKDPDRIRGGTYAAIHWSEVAFSKVEHGATIIDIWNKIIKPTTDLPGGYALLESTNNGKNGWYDIWHSAKDFKFKTLKVGLDDMVYMNLISAEKYAEIESETHPDVFRQEYLCEWVTFQGRAYNEFEEAKHVAKVDPPESWQTVIAAIDWGYHPSATCILFAYVKDEVLYIFDEHYEHNELPKITADAIEFKKSQWDIKTLALVADHDPARIEELRLRNIVCAQADKVDVMGARMEIKELFYFDKVVIDPRCKMLRRDIGAAVWHPKKEGQLDDAQCTWGHWDAESAFRYLVRELSKAEADEPDDNPHLDEQSRAAYDLNRTLIEDSMENH